MSSLPVSPAFDNPLYDRRASRNRIVVGSILLVALAAISFHVFVLSTDWRRMGGLSQVLETISRFTPDLSILPSLVQPLLETLLIAFWGTFLGFLVAMPVGYIAARNVTPLSWVSYIAGRTIIVLTRSVHELIFALIFVAAVGLGPLPGILALGVRSIGFLAKIIAEAIENINRDPIEALRAAGAGPVSQFVFGVVPQIYPTVAGTLIFQLDINISRAAILGMVGAGGIGLEFAQYMQMFQLEKAAAVAIAVVLLVIVGEYISNRIRVRLI